MVGLYAPNVPGLSHSTLVWLGILREPGGSVQPPAAKSTCRRAHTGYFISAGFLAFSWRSKLYKNFCHHVNPRRCSFQLHRPPQTGHHYRLSPHFLFGHKCGRYNDRSRGYCVTSIVIASLSYTTPLLRLVSTTIDHVPLVGALDHVTKNSSLKRFFNSVTVASTIFSVFA